jgi:hypothetical protein
MIPFQIDYNDLSRYISGDGERYPCVILVWRQANGNIMIRDCKELRDFEKRMIREDKTSLKKKIALYEDLYKLSRKILAQEGFKTDPFEGIEVVIKVAKVVNSV